GPIEITGDDGNPLAGSGPNGNGGHPAPKQLSGTARRANNGRRATPRPAAQTAIGAGAKVGRNDPCPCGSGKKYKQCHGRTGAPVQSGRS
ncbi:MAG TPA: SEC-C metal-binding domain-containing protein, partial [Chloroflexota bacterium]|nr:SEC-C metal-binding domain-containing protein [Chloroflexota bacterium]